MKISRRSSVSRPSEVISWLDILNEFSAQSADKKSFDNYRALIVGNQFSGKTKLLASMLPHKEITAKQGAGLQYIPFDVFDTNEDTEAFTQLNAWILDGNPAFQSLLRFVIDEDTVIKEKLIAIIVLDLSAPWECLSSLKRWVSILEKYIDSLNINPKVLLGLKKKYGNMEFGRKSDVTANETNDSSVQNDDDLEDSNKLGLGFPVIVVGTKTDSFSNLELNFKISGDIQDLLQVHLRQACLKMNFGLVYTSIRDYTNITLLYDYVTSLLYGLPFKDSPIVIERKSIFIPIGWDSQKKIEILKENLTSVCSDDPLDVYIHEPFDKSKVEKTMLAKLDDEEFYKTVNERINSDSSSATPAIPQQFNPARTSSPMQYKPESHSQLSRKSSNQLFKGGNEANTGELATFFSTLLCNKKDGNSKF